ncbi:hypothetical protein HELRODRAFT_183282 [Helobdella robusta]|uniref:SUEL-type lectin domain-containing protein n=1 Tax=Helobdella robusta TaxID=6412 RepID=T1FJE7_HELRO|nr:hypothetical protein HELRODRAFT_183282 [Helobdella robusta]ESO11338.1 hypothetical protein HELRODRAFT_183282 [Helobdella robusta]
MFTDYNINNNEDDDDVNDDVIENVIVLRNVGFICVMVQPESFNTTCPVDHVILVTSARYGRMRGGRCIQATFGHVGCSAEVTSYLDEVCSGRGSCSFPVFRLFDEKPCPSDMMSYLEASHKCVRAQNKENQFTNTSNNNMINKKSVTNINNIVNNNNDINNNIGYLLISKQLPTCPWKLQVDQQQKITFSIFSFIINNNNNMAQQQQHHCNINLMFEEPMFMSAKTHDVDVCRLKIRKTLLYSSRKNLVIIYVHNNNNNINNNNINNNNHNNNYNNDNFGGETFSTPYLLQYEIVGCPKISPPANAWVLQDDHKATIRCNFSDETWFLACDGSLWSGSYGSCAKHDAGISITLESSLNRYNPLPIAVAIGIILGIVIGSVPLALVYACLRRRWQEQQQTELEQYQQQHQQHQKHQQENYNNNNINNNIIEHHHTTSRYFFTDDNSINNQTTTSTPAFYDGQQQQHQQQHQQNYHPITSTTQNINKDINDDDEDDMDLGRPQQHHQSSPTTSTTHIYNLVTNPLKCKHSLKSNNNNINNIDNISTYTSASPTSCSNFNCYKVECLDKPDVMQLTEQNYQHQQQQPYFYLTLNKQEQDQQQHQQAQQHQQQHQQQQHRQQPSVGESSSFKTFNKISSTEAMNAKFAI